MYEFCWNLKKKFIRAYLLSYSIWKWYFLKYVCRKSYEINKELFQLFSCFFKKCWAANFLKMLLIICFKSALAVKSLWIPELCELDADQMFSAIMIYSHKTDSDAINSTTKWSLTKLGTCKNSDLKFQLKSQASKSKTALDS